MTGPQSNDAWRAASKRGALPACWRSRTYAVRRFAVRTLRATVWAARSTDWLLPKDAYVAEVHTMEGKMERNRVLFAVCATEDDAKELAEIYATQHLRAARRRVKGAA